jgi:hypothetical protein
MTDARISWPRCRALGTHGGGSGILVDDELARAVRRESAAAVGYWWEVGGRTVAWWRRALCVTVTNNEASNRLIRSAAKLGVAAARERGLTEEEEDARSERAKRLNLARQLAPLPGAARGRIDREPPLTPQVAASRAVGHRAVVLLANQE